MSTEVQTADQLTQKTCVPCEGGIPKLSATEAESQIRAVEGWLLSEDHAEIHKEWTVKNFAEAIRFLNEVAQIAEQEGHHPDLHLTGYRNLSIKLTTHAIGGLSENDFILAAKINELPIELKS